jgi:CheY-like chemotaxis protein
VFFVGLPPTTGSFLALQLRSWGLNVASLPPREEALETLRDSVSDIENLVLVAFLGSHSHSILELLRQAQHDQRLQGMRLILAHSLYEKAERRRVESVEFSEFLPIPFRRSHLAAFLTGRSRSTTTVESPSVGTPFTDLARARILLAEDNPVNQKVAITVLKKLGLQADLARNGREALEAVKAASFDLILMDCQMPEMDGFEATRQIRRMEDGKVHVPIVAMTANALAGDKERCLEVGMDDYVPKPITIESVREALKRWLSPATMT